MKRFLLIILIAASLHAMGLTRMPFHPPKPKPKPISHWLKDGNKNRPRVVVPYHPLGAGKWARLGRQPDS